MIASLIRNNKLKLLTIVLAWIPTPVFAANGSVEILNYKTDGDRVIMKVKVIDAENQPVSGLSRDNFQIKTFDEKGIEANPVVDKVLSPELSQPEPANIIILLDMSGSMQQRDGSKVRKLNGATKAIRKILQELRNQKLPYQIAIVPFGFADDPKKCSVVYDVNESKIRKNFYEIKDTNLDSQIDELASQNVCAATNLYQPIQEAVEFLALKGKSLQTKETTDPGLVGFLTNFIKNLFNSPQAKENTDPRLAVILLSDGYHVIDRSHEQAQFNSLREILQKYSTKVTVHTIGYGETLQELRDRTNCPLTNAELTVNNVSLICKLPNLSSQEFIFEAMQLITEKDNQFAPPQTDINTFIVDEKRLKDIASATGGLYKFSTSSEDVANSLVTFFKTLREYEVTYKQKDAKQAVEYKTILTVTSQERNFEFSSPEKLIRLNNFGFQAALSWQEYLIVLGITFSFAITWFFIFWRWSSQLRNELEKVAKVSKQ